MNDLNFRHEGVIETGEGDVLTLEVLDAGEHSNNYDDPTLDDAAHVNDEESAREEEPV